MRTRVHFSSETVSFEPFFEPSILKILKSKIVFETAKNVSEHVDHGMIQKTPIASFGRLLTAKARTLVD